MAETDFDIVHFPDKPGYVSEIEGLMLGIVRHEAGLRIHGAAANNSGMLAAFSFYG